MGFNLVLFVFPFIVCQVHVGCGTPTKGSDNQTPVAGSTPSFDEEEYKRALIGTPTIAPADLAGSQQTAWDAVKPIKELNLVGIPNMSYDDLLKIFCYVRDTKLVKDTDGTLRRLSWLFPDSGCESRAELATRGIFAAGMTVPKKIIAYRQGNSVDAKTGNKKGGKVSWMYHVAITYLVGKVVYILDPTLQPKKPLTLEEWHSVLGAKDDLVYAICSPTLWWLNSKCYQFEPASDPVAVHLPLLEKERARLEELNRDPAKELGENPPWV